MNSLTFAGFNLDFLSLAPRTCVGVLGKPCATRFVPAAKDHVQCHTCYKQERALIAAPREQERASTAQTREQAHQARIATAVAWARELFEADAVPEGVRVTIRGVEVRVDFGGTYANFRSTRLQQQMDAAREQTSHMSIERQVRDRMEFRAACTEFARAAFEAGALVRSEQLKITTLNAQVAVAYEGVSVTFISERLTSQLEEAKKEASRKAAATHAAQEKANREQRAAAAKAKAEAEAAQPAGKNGKGGKNKGGDKNSRKQQARAAA